MAEPLDNLYFNWLCAKVIDTTITSPSLTYWELFRMMHRTEFVWLISGDDNRAEDGKELRREFLIMADIPDEQEWRSLECSMLEMLVSFVRRLEYMTDVPYRDWFWEILDNLGLKKFSDADPNSYLIAKILEQVIWRTYEDNGVGGMFPIMIPHMDQRQREIWYQFCDYLSDQDRMP